MFEWKTEENGSTVDIAIRSQSFDDLLEIPQTEQKQKPPPKILAPVIIEVADEEIIKEIEMTKETRFEMVIVKQVQESMPEENVEEVFTVVEVQPTLVGGIKAFYN